MFAGPILLIYYRCRKYPLIGRLQLPKRALLCFAWATEILLEKGRRDSSYQYHYAE